MSRTEGGTTDDPPADDRLADDPLVGDRLADELPADAPLVEDPDVSRDFADAAEDSKALRRARRRAGWMSVGLLAVAAGMAVSVGIDPQRPWFQPLDDRWLEFMSDHRNGPMTAVANVLNVVGSGVVTWPLRLAAVAVLAVRRRFTQLVVFVVAVVASELCIGPLKALIDRPRPLDRIVHTTSASFPSGHAVATAVTAFGLVIAFLPRGRRRLHWMIAASFLGGAMAWSRAYLGAHWASDTVAGICIGVGLAVGVEVVFTTTRTTAAEVAQLSPDPGPGVVE